MSAAFDRPERACFNLTHYARLIPESHAVFVMPPGCSRILRLSAIEEGISDRFTMFNLEPSDVINGDVESILIGGTQDTIERLTDEDRRPKILALFASCVDSFIGTDHEYVMSDLSAYAPDIQFLDLAVDPINRDTLPPLVRLHNAVTDLFERTGESRSVNWLGSYLPPAADHPLRQRLEKQGLTSLHLMDFETLADLRRMGNSAANIAATAVAVPALKRLKTRLGIPYYNAINPADPDSMTEEELMAR